MAKQVFIVNAWIVDANGTYNPIASGYPKPFYSKNYGDDVEKTRRRAESDMYAQWSQMLLNDTRQVQTVMLTTADGFVVKQETTGGFIEETPAEA